MSCRWDDEAVVRHDRGDAGAPPPRRPRSAPPARRPRYSSIGCPACLASPPTPPWPPSVRGGTPPSIDRGWWIERGPNGGYLAAIVLRAVVAEVGRSSPAPPVADAPLPAPARRRRRARSPSRIERVGRGLTTASARLTQGGPRLHPGAGGAGGRPARPRAPRPPGTGRGLARATHRPEPAPRQARPTSRSATGSSVRPVHRHARPSARDRRGGDGRLDPHGRRRLRSTTCCSPPSPTRGRPPSSRASRSPLGVPTDRAHRPLPGRRARAPGVVPRPLPDARGGARATSRRAERCGRTDGRLLAESRQLAVLLDAARRLTPARGHGAGEHRPLARPPPRAGPRPARRSRPAGRSTTPGRARSANS